MAERPRIPPDSVIKNGDMSLTLTSKATIVQSITLGTYSYSWAGTSPLGNLAIQISDDYALNPDGSVKTAGTWNTVYVTLNGSSTVNAIPVSGNTGMGVVEWSTGSYAIRTQYTPTSGTGTLQATFVGKVA